VHLLVADWRVVAMQCMAVWRSCFTIRYTLGFNMLAHSCCYQCIRVAQYSECRQPCLRAQLCMHMTGPG
jgi:hypothetical protein